MTLVGRPWLQALLLCAVVTGLLSPVLGAGFIWDDYHQIRDSETIQDLGAIPDHFAANVRQGVGVDRRNAQGVDIYRPVFVTALALEYALLGGADARGFHLFSLLWHVLNCLLLWLLARRLLGPPWAAVAVVVLFAFHPVAAEAWIFISSQTDLAATTALLGSILLLDVFCSSGAEEATTPQVGPSSAARWTAAVAAGVLFLLGLLTKEVVIMALPPVCLWLWRSRRVAVRFQVPLAASAVVFLAMRTAVLGGLQATGGSGEQRLQAIHHAPLLMVDGLRGLLSLGPVGYRELAYEYELLPWAWTGLALLVLVALSVAVWRYRQQLRLGPLALSIYLLMLAPVGLVVTIVSWGGFGRYLYLPCAFLCLAGVELALVLGSRIEPDRPWHRPVGWLVIATFLVFQQGAVQAAIRAYATPEGLSSEAIVAAPYAATGYLLRANDLLQEGDLSGALEFYRQAEERTHAIRQPKVERNIAVTCLWSGAPTEALRRGQLYEETYGRGPKSSFLMGTALMMLGRWQESAEVTLYALARASDDPDLLELQRTLTARHPDPEGYRAWLREALLAPENAPIAPVLLNELEAAAPDVTTPAEGASARSSSR